MGYKVQILFPEKGVQCLPAKKGGHFNVFGVAALLVAHLVFGRVRNVHRVSGAEIGCDHPVHRRLVAGDLWIVVKRFAERSVNIHPIQAVVNRRRKQVNRCFAFARKIAEQLSMAHFMEFRFPKLHTGAQKPVVFVPIFHLRRVVGIVDLRVSDAVAVEHDVHVNLQIQHRVAVDGRVAQQF